MDTQLIIRAWKDPDFRARLSTEQRASLPDSPSGSPITELDETELRDIIGGRDSLTINTTGCVGQVQHTCGIIMCMPPAEF